ncbi:MAG TPA: ABC transporter permease [Gemmatimonadaceae bacterium]|nr:ABC transporter permease [Gemmatimonadaceae bacterium]
MTDVAAGFLESTVRTATPLLFAALGETVVERSGVINIALEASIICGALGGAVASASADPWTALAVAAVSGLAISIVFAVFVVVLRSDQIITGTAITLLGLGLTGTLYRQIFGPSGAALTITTMHPTPIPLLSGIPVIGRAFFSQPAATYLIYLLLPAMTWWMYKTHPGLGLRAIGENPEAAIAAGIRASRVQFTAILFGGLMGGLAGGFLVIAQAGTFSEGMSAGRGFIAIAIVVLGRWKPVGVAIAALVFGATTALQYLFQTMGWDLPYQLFLALPYVLTLLALAGIAGRAHAPASLGKWITTE